MQVQFLGFFLVVDVQLQNIIVIVILIKYDILYICNSYGFRFKFICLQSFSPPIFCMFTDYDGNYNLSIHCPCLSCRISYLAVLRRV